MPIPNLHIMLISRFATCYLFVTILSYHRIYDLSIFSTLCGEFFLKGEIF
jgi:hypothetical protein